MNKAATLLLSLSLLLGAFSLFPAWAAGTDEGCSSTMGLSALSVALMAVVAPAVKPSKKFRAAKRRNSP